jgi:hypothetical protein
MKRVWERNQGFLLGFLVGGIVGVCSQGCAILQVSAPKTSGASNVIEAPKVGSGKVDAQIPITP